MTIRTRLVVASACVCLLSWSVVAASKKVSSATATIQIELADVLYDHADYRSAMHTYLAATNCEDVTLRDRARAGTVRSALRIAEFGVAVTQLAGLDSSRATDPATLALAGDALWASGRFDEGEKAYRDALTLEPGSPRARHGLAKALASKNQMESALNEVQAALRDAPTDSDIQHTLGTIYERMHRYSEAATAYLSFLAVLKGADRSDRIQWARNHISFLRSFDGTVPFEMVSKGNVKRHVLEFRLVNGKVLLKGKINGGKSVDFALDTGAEHTVLSEKTARRFGIEALNDTLTAGVGDAGVRGLKIAKLRSLEIGTLTVFNLPCLIKSPAMRELPVDDTDGFSPLALGLSMTVDYRNRRLYIGEPLPAPSPARELPLRFTRLATVQGDVDGTPMSFIVDTGGEAISLNTSAARGLFTPADRHRIKLQVYGASGLDPEAYLLPGVNLVFGSLKMPNQPVVVLDLRAPSVLLGYEIGGILGYRMLGKYRVEFDLERSVLRLGDL
ncbi:MAG TPA: aspartyl protease family protein [Vicinamibacterales bacterium]